MRKRSSLISNLIGLLIALLLLVLVTACNDLDLLEQSEPAPVIPEEALAELFPERDNLELVVSVRDAALLEKLNPEWLRRYPALRIRADASLVPGDCQVRSRFGLTDARLQTKLAALEHGLLST